MTSAFAPEMIARLERINRGQFAHYVSLDDEAALRLYHQDLAIHQSVETIERIMAECAQVRRPVELRISLIRFFHNLALARNREVAELQDRLTQISEERPAPVWDESETLTEAAR